MSGQEIAVTTPPARSTDAAQANLNLRTDTSYDEAGNRVAVTGPQGIVTRYEYDDLGRLTAVVENYLPASAASNDTNVRTEYTYNVSGQRLTIRDGNATLNNTTAVTSFSYDGLGRQVSERDPLGNTSSTTYDLLGRQTSQTDANGYTTTYSYDGVSRMVKIDYPDPDTDVTYAYDAESRRSTMTDETGTTTWTYNALGEVASVTDGNGKEVGYTYTGTGNRDTLTYPDGGAVDYTYNDLGQLTTVSQAGQTVAGYTYTTAGQLSASTYGDEVSSAYTYSDSGRLLDITHSLTDGTTLSSFTYSYDASGDRVSVVESGVPNGVATETATPTETPTVTDSARFLL